MQEYVMLAGRGLGKTAAIVEEIHALIVAGERPTILVVHQNIDAVKEFHDIWVSAYPHIPRPEYATLRNTLNLRGRRWKWVYVEDVDLYEDGRDEPKLRDVLVGTTPDAVVTYTTGRTTLSMKSHNEPVPESHLLRSLKRFRKR